MIAYYSIKRVTLSYLKSRVSKEALPITVFGRLAMMGMGEMNKKQRKTLEAIFENPARSDVRWSDVEKLFRALECEITEGSGSCIRVRLENERAVFHRPHPEPETDKGAIKSVRRFLVNAGIDPHRKG